MGTRGGEFNWLPQPGSPYTGISTYFWIVTNREEKSRKGKIQQIDAIGFFTKMRNSLGHDNKRDNSTLTVSIDHPCSSFSGRRWMLGLVKVQAAFNIL
jgi:hypothetical protein